MSSQRICIVGVPGSGKSTFAERLGKSLDAPVYHLDQHMFEPGGKKKDKEDRLKIQQEMMNQISWIIEGCAISILEKRYTQSTAVIYLHFSRLFCIYRLLRRFFSPRQAQKTGALRGINWRLLKYMWVFDRKKGTRIRNLHKKHPAIPFYIFKNPHQMKQFLKAQKR